MPAKTFSYLAGRLGELGLAYLHLVESLGGGRTMRVPDEERIAPEIRKAFNGALILNGGYLLDSANNAINSGAADLISFGEPFLANPDLPFRFLHNLPLNTPNTATYYTGEEKGLIDYPVADKQAARV